MLTKCKKKIEINVKKIFDFKNFYHLSLFIGEVLLSGIVVNNAILLVERITKLLRQGSSIKEAIFTGASQRLRPIMMTTATTVFGLLPLVASGGDSRLWGTLALATIGGLSSSALLVLLVTPVVYRIFVRGR